MMTNQKQVILDFIEEFYKDLSDADKAVLTLRLYVLYTRLKGI